MSNFTVTFVSVDVPSSATTGQAILPTVVVKNTSSTTPCAVAVAWDDDVTDTLPFESVTIVGPNDNLHISQQTIYPSARTMPSNSVNWRLNLLKINDDGISWSESGVYRDIVITNASSDDNGIPSDGSDDTTSFWDKYKLWILGGGALALIFSGTFFYMKRR